MSKRKSGKRFTCTSEAQKRAIRRNYAIRKQNSEQERVEAPYPHFRYYRKSKHPALIVGEQTTENNEEEYRYRKVTHSERDGRHINEKLDPNPNPSDPKPMYIAKRIRHDDKDNFEPRPLPWKYPKKDK